MDDPSILDPADVILRITTAAICGSDLHLYHGEIPGMLPGMVIGHEYVGVVEEVGAQVRVFCPGDRVVGSFHVGCGKCLTCRRGDFHQCQYGGVLGYGMAFGNLNGTQAEYARIPYADYTLRKVPEGLTDEQALFSGDILTTAYGAVMNSSFKPGETVAARVIAIDLMRQRTEMAANLGAIPVWSQQVNPVSRINELTHGEGVDVAIEVVGGPATIRLAFDLVRGGGRISAIGVTAEETFEFPLVTSLAKHITFRVGVANIHRDIDTTLALVQSGRIDPTVVVSHRLPLDQAIEGYRVFASREASKVLLTVN